MSRDTQLLEREAIVAARQPEGDPPLARLPEALAEAIRRQPIVFIAELAVLLETSVRTIRRQLRAGTFFIPPAPFVDRRYRWSRERVYRAIAETTAGSHRRALLGPRLAHHGSTVSPRSDARKGNLSTGNGVAR